MTLQGLPRPGRLKFGVPVGGAADLESFVLGQQILGNPAEVMAIELAMGGLVLRSESPILVAITGSVGAIRVDSTSPVGTGPHWLQPGQSLEVSPSGQGVYGYISVRGGWEGDLNEGLRIGHRIFGEPISLAGRERGKQPLPFWPGPQATSDDIEKLSSETFIVTPQLDRRGIRLAGPLLTGGEIRSEPTTPGAIQIPPGGDPIVIGVDGPTLGGYRKVAVLTRESLDELYQRMPGTKVRFVEA